MSITQPECVFVALGI